MTDDRSRNIRPLSREDTQALKGLAILMMIVHHCLAFPERLPEALRPVYLLPVPGTEFAGILELLGRFGKLCVPVFFFLAGFGQYRSYEERGHFDVFGRLKSFFFAYWKVFAVFVPAALIFFAHQPPLYESSRIYLHYDSFDLFAAVRCFFGVDAWYNSEWWFIAPWAVCTCLLPLWSMLIRRHSFPVNLLFLIVLAVCYRLSEPWTGSTLWQLIFGQSAYSLCFWLGAILAKGHELERFMLRWEKAGLNSIPVLSAALLLMILLRVGWPAYNMELSVFVAPPVIFLLAMLLRKCRRAPRLLLVYGRHSTTIWLTHTFFFFYFLPVQKLVYFPHFAPLTALWACAFCLIIAAVFDLLWSIPKIRKQ